MLYKKKININVTCELTNRYISFIFFFFIIGLMFFIPIFPQVLGDETEATISISHAKISVSSAYISVLHSERKGGQVSELIIRLNVVLDKLIEAERALESDNNNLATQLANSVIEASKLIYEEALIKKNEAEVRRKIEFRNRLLLSAGSVCIILTGGYFSWRRFKDYYFNRLTGLHPEVLYDESR